MPKKFMDAETAKKWIYKQRVESSWGRIIQHIESDRTFAAMSAYLAGYDEMENNERHNQLRKDIRDMGYGYIEMDSGYTYDDDTREFEKSFFIPNISYKDALHLGRKYEQESILWKDSEGFFEIRCDTEEVNMTFDTGRDNGGQITFDPETLKIAFSQLRKSNKNQRKPFAFRAESVGRTESEGDQRNFEIRVYAKPVRSEFYQAQKEKKMPKVQRIGLRRYLLDKKMGRV